MRVAMHAAAPCPVEVKRRMIDWWGPVLHEYYAATEAAGVTLIDSAAVAGATRARSAGRAWASCTSATRPSPDQEELPTGEVGLVYFERDVMPFSYHNDPEKTRAAQHPHHDTWATTGDIGRVDEDGFLYLTDRKAFMIISGGVNIYPQEVENALTLHPAVLRRRGDRRARRRDGRAGQGGRAARRGRRARARAGRGADRRTCASGSPTSRRRAVVDFVDALPRTPTGKLVKRKRAREPT